MVGQQRDWRDLEVKAGRVIFNWPKKKKKILSLGTNESWQGSFLGKVQMERWGRYLHSERRTWILREGKGKDKGVVFSLIRKSQVCYRAKKKNVEESGGHRLVICCGFEDSGMKGGD